MARGGGCARPAGFPAGAAARPSRGCPRRARAPRAALWSAELPRADACAVFQDFFFYSLVYDPQQKTLLADKGEIRVGNRYQADVSDLLQEGRARRPLPLSSSRVLFEWVARLADSCRSARTVEGHGPGSRLPPHPRLQRPRGPWVGWTPNKQQRPERGAAVTGGRVSRPHEGRLPRLPQRGDVPSVSLFLKTLPLSRARLRRVVAVTCPPAVPAWL